MSDYIKSRREVHSVIRNKTIPKTDKLISKLISEGGNSWFISNAPSQSILSLREGLWVQYKKYERIFFGECIKELYKTNPDIAQKLLAPEIIGRLLNALNSEKTEEKLDGMISLVEHGTTLVFEEIYDLAKSITQSRRSRAGQEFQGIISVLMQQYGFNYDSQAKLGKARFLGAGLKMVDGVFPSFDEFLIAKTRSCIFTLKTTLRERWQEVVEEIERVGVPSIYLLTLDPDVTPSTVKLLADHNITLVNLESFKLKHKDTSNVMSYEELFLTELPEKLEWWRRQT